MRRIVLLTLLVPAFCIPLFSADWDPRSAAKYLDQRQKEWFAWPIAQQSGGPCVSCHTGLPYLLVRPRLREVLGEGTDKTPFEKGLLEGFRARLASGESMFKSLKDEPLRSQARGVEAVLSVVAFSLDDQFSSNDGDATAWNRLWSLRSQGGETRKHLWPWFNLNLHPYESEASAYFGAALVAVAAGRSLEGTRRNGSSADIRELTSYLRREFPNQPLHNRLFALWASAKLPGIVDRGERKSLVRDLMKAQEADGGWRIATLGPWAERPAKPEPAGSDGYATGLVVFALGQAGVGCKDARLERAREWLRSHQDPDNGAWSLRSMNKQYALGSMQASFMNDAATSYAALALLDPGRCKSSSLAQAQHPDR